MTTPTDIGARTRLFLIALAAIASVAISLPSLAAASTSVSEPAATPAEEPSSIGPVVSDDSAEDPAPQPVPEPPVAEPVAEPPVAEPTPVAPIAEPLPLDSPTTEPPPVETPTAEPSPLETPPAEPVDNGEFAPPVTDGFEDPALGSPVALPTTPEAAVPEEPELAPVVEQAQSVVIQISSRAETGRPLTHELRAILIADAPSRLTTLADVSSAGTTGRTASGRPARKSVERPESEVSWPLQIPSPPTPPVSSPLSATFSGPGPTGSSILTDLALAMSAVILAFSLMARVARPVSSRLHGAALFARVPRPG